MINNGSQLVDAAKTTWWKQCENQTWTM